MTKNLKILLIILGVVAVGGLGVLAFQSLEPIKEAVKIEEPEVDEPALEEESEEPIIDDTKEEEDYTVVEKVLHGGGGRTVKIKEKEGNWNTIIEGVGFELDYPREWELYADVGTSIGFEKIFNNNSKERCSIYVLCGGQIMGYDDERYGDKQIYFYGPYEEEEILCRAILSTFLQDEALLECQNVMKGIVSSVRPKE